MVVRPSDRDGRGLRLNELGDFARSLARQVWERDDRLTKQTEDQELLSWLAGKFPSYVTKPFAQRHIRLWSWFEELIPGLKPAARVEVWPRGGAKSTTAEMGVARVGSKLTRRFALYVSATQEQADLHVGNIADLFEKLGYDRALNKYGSSKGWRRNQLRVSNGFNVQALGLDTASRGIKIEEFRPDLIIFDDIDSQDDSPKTVEKKLRAIKSAIIPAGSSDCAILFIQNLIHEDGIVAQLVDGRADFLLDRDVPEVSVAVDGLKVESVDRGDGRKLWKITEGTPTWEGQDLSVCEQQINEWGLKTFLREAQHEVDQADGFFFDHTKVNIVDEIPATIRIKRWCRAWDFAGTEGGGDYTAGPFIGLATNGTYWWTELEHDQIGSNKVRALVKGTAHKDRNRYGRVKIHIPQDPGQAGKDQAEQYKELLSEFSEDLIIETVSGSKATRASGWQDAWNSGNVYMLKADWNHGAIQEHRKFREDEEHEFDDIIDGCSDCHTTLAEPTKELQFTW